MIVVARRADAAEAGGARCPPELVAGTSPASIDLAEDREKWNALCDELRIPQPPGGTAADLEQALAIVDEIGFPVLVRPSYVLGGRAMQIVHDRNHLAAGDGRAGRLRQRSAARAGCRPSGRC